MSNLLRRSVSALLVTLIAVPLTGLQATSAHAQGASERPLPRFVSLRAERVNMRVGPGRKYQVDWLYTKRGLPLEIIQEFENWRKVRDSEGDEGWILSTLLSGKRTALVAPWLRGENGTVALKRKPGSDAPTVALMEASVLAEVRTCSGGWCEVRADGISGYAEQVGLWGVYPDEVID